MAKLRFRYHLMLMKIYNRLGTKVLRFINSQFNKHSIACDEIVERHKDEF